MKMRHRRLLKQCIAKHRWIVNHYKKSITRVSDALREAFGLAAKAALGFAGALKGMVRDTPALPAHVVRGVPYYRRHIRIPTWYR